MVQIMKICIQLLLLHFFHCGACVHPQTWDPFVPDTEQTHNSYFPQMQKRGRKPCNSSHLIVN